MCSPVVEGAHRRRDVGGGDEVLAVFDAELRNAGMERDRKQAVCWVVNCYCGLMSYESQVPT